MNTANINNISLRRFAHLLSYEFRSSCVLPKVVITGIVLLAFVMIKRVISYSMDDITTLFFPIFGFGSDMLLLFATSSPFIFYYDILKKGKRALYIALPATATEKYLSLLAHTFVTTPLLIFAMKFCIDYIATGFDAKYFINTFKQLAEAKNIPVLWGMISYTTFLLLIFVQHKVWIFIAVLFGSLILVLNYIGFVLDFTISDDGYVTPTKYAEAYTIAWRIVSFTAIAVLQPLIFYGIKKIKA